MSNKEIFLSYSNDRDGFVLLLNNGEEVAFFDKNEPILNLFSYLKDISRLIVATGLDFDAQMEDLYLKLIGNSLSIRHQIMKKREIEFPLDTEALAMMESSLPLENFMIAIIAIGRSHEVGELGIDLS